MDPELKTYLEAEFAGINQRLAGHDRRVDEIKDEIRQGRVLLENLDSNVKAVAEGYSALDEKLDRFRREIRDQRREDRLDNRVAFRALKRRDDDFEGRVAALEANPG